MSVLESMDSFIFMASYHSARRKNRIAVGFCVISGHIALTVISSLKVYDSPVCVYKGIQVWSERDHYDPLFAKTLSIEIYVFTVKLMIIPSMIWKIARVKVSADT